ncbi:MAG: CDGSH iron-sulfur domain-containing protein [Phycisphaerae bacterium]|nr:CDGSH iron-sulfur domain-containing protein [Phycisphaerae bacterium]
MPRLIRLEATTPLKIEPNDFPRDEQGNLRKMSLCACGLSQKFPLCDGAHKRLCVSERPDRLYVYDRSRQNVIEERDDR